MLPQHSYQRGKQSLDQLLLVRQTWRVARIAKTYRNVCPEENLADTILLAVSLQINIYYVTNNPPLKLRRGIEPVLPTQASPSQPTPVVKLTFSSSVS